MSRTADLLLGAVARLRAAGVADPVRDARLLLAHALGIGADRLTLHLADPVPAAAQALFQAAVTARAARQPLSQITGKRLFWGRNFAVTADVLDPRPETETLIAAALKQPFATALDLGTGSGAILLTVLAERPQARGLGVDLSPAALAVAQRNAQALGLADRAEFRHSDWFAAIPERFDLILSNPPYIGAGEIPSLSPEVRDWEPRAALVPEGDDGSGLAAYRKIIGAAPDHLSFGGALMVEIGASQGRAVGALMAQAGLHHIQVLPDMDGRDRVVRATRPGPVSV